MGGRQSVLALTAAEPLFTRPKSQRPEARTRSRLSGRHSQSVLGLPHHKLIACVVARDLLLAVRAAQVTDAKLRDEALRSAKSAFRNCAESADAFRWPTRLGRSRSLAGKRARLEPRSMSRPDPDPPAIAVRCHPTDPQLQSRAPVPPAVPDARAGLLDRRLVVVTGKGGTGKSTLSAALALASARRGKKTLICEVVAKERVADFFGRPPSGTQIRELLPNLYSVHVRPREAMREYALMTLKYETLYKIAFENAAARYFLSAAPSLAEIVMLGKVWWHATQEMERGKPRWDLVVLDAPATGHGLAFLSVPAVFLRLVQEGPLARDMRGMQSLLADPARCAISIVTLPEEMPANEAIELDRALRSG